MKITESVREIIANAKSLAWRLIELDCLGAAHMALAIAELSDDLENEIHNEGVEDNDI